MDELILPLDAFIRSVGVNRKSPHAFFLGAGASMSSGIPTAGRCIWEWKRKIFLTNNPGLEDEFSELTLPSVQERIQRWLDAKGHPPLDAPQEYSEYIKRCFPIPEHRRRYFQDLVQKASPHVGYKVLCLLGCEGIVRSVWSTNFDGLTARAAADFPITPIEIGIDCRERVFRQPARGELLCVSLHGEYRYDELKNTDEELRTQDAALRAALVKELEYTNLIVSGYSGRDASVMAALTAAVSHPGTGAIYWCGHGDGDPPQIVRFLLEAARAQKRISYYIPAHGFDDLLIRLGLHCLSDDHLKKAQEIAGEVAADPTTARAPFTISPGPLAGVVKSNCFPVQCPSDVLTFEVTGLPEERVWNNLRELTTGTRVVAVPFKRKVLAFGTIDGVKDLFGERIKGKIDRTPIDAKELCYEDGAIVSLLLTTLLRCFEGLGFRSNGKRLVWDAKNSQKRAINGAAAFMHQSAILSLRMISGRQYLVIKPSVVFVDAQGQLLPEEDVRTEKLAFLGYQHNAKFNNALNQWSNLLIGGGRDLEFPAGCGSTFRFRLVKFPLYSKIVDYSLPKGMGLKPEIEKRVSQMGMQLAEPTLVFSNRTDQPGYVHDTHPIRGILENRPYDFSLTKRGLADRVSIGVVCPAAEAATFQGYLRGLLLAHKPKEKEQDYILPFPGFHSAFGLPIHIPQRGENAWIDCPEPSPRFTEKEGTVELGRNIKTCIDTIRASSTVNAVVVCIPERWFLWRRYETDTERMDLHDFVKAYCVHKGIPTQFLEEDTLHNPYDCRIAWWLSLALYVKSMRTPWVLDSLEPGTAFVGLGFSIDKKAIPGQHIVVGCSHIYSEKGEGLQYRLGKIDNPIIRRGNPFLSLEDARRVGDGIRQLFYEAMLRLPERVVIHKRTPFGGDECKGLVQGLVGIKTVDMIEINIEDKIRYLASVLDFQGGLKEDGYPVRRGTVVPYEKSTALLWAHGVTNAVNSRMKYYQGKRRIPAPLLLRRYLGQTPLEILCREILGLSKMNWNTFDMYTRLPATIESSNKIAQIGSLLERFGRNSYDYRLFM